MTTLIATVIINGKRQPLVADWPATQGVRADYAEGLLAPHYPVPALNVCLWCGTPIKYGTSTTCCYLGTGYWCPDFCFNVN